MWRICLCSPIISTDNQCSENQCKILICRSYISVWFIFVPIRHIFNFIYCCGFEFDIIRYIKLQCLIQFCFILLEIKIKIQYYVCSILHLLEFEFALFLFYHSLRQVFLTKDNGPFSLLTPLMIDFFIKYFDYRITHECDLSFGSLS